MKYPKSWVEKQQRKSTAVVSKKLEARVDMSDEIVDNGLCPVCGKPMERVIANDQPALCCFSDRVVLPIKNDVLNG